MSEKVGVLYYSTTASDETDAVVVYYKVMGSVSSSVSGAGLSDSLDMQI